MMTLEEFKENKAQCRFFEDWYSFISYYHKSRGFNDADGDYNYMTIQFTKYHVTEALKQAAKKAELIEVAKYSNNGVCQISNGMGDSYELDTNSILNAYPLDLIK